MSKRVKKRTYLDLDLQVVKLLKEEADRNYRTVPQQLRFIVMGWIDGRFLCEDTTSHDTQDPQGDVEGRGEETS